MDEFNEFIRHRDMYKNPHILPNAIEVIKKLSEKYDIYILSSCVNPFDIEGSGNLFMVKYNFLRKLLPFISPKNFILTSAKHLFKADVQIDDVIANFSDDVDLKILFTSYHNKNITEEELKKRVLSVLVMIGEKVGMLLLKFFYQTMLKKTLILT